MSHHPAYDQLFQRHAQLHRLDHLKSIAHWDSSAMLPPKGAPARSQALAELDGLIHQLGTEPAWPTLLASAADEPLDDWQAANLREMRRLWQARSALPQSLVQARAEACARCDHGWRSQRPANDWAGLVPNLREVVRLTRQQARLMADQSGLGPYEALLDSHEPGLRSADLGRLFGDLRQWLPGLIQDVLAHQESRPVLQPVGPFDIDHQRALAHDVVALLGFDFQAGRLDESAHPFCGGVPEDVRLTTRYRADDLLIGLMGTVHETGHGRYEQNLPRDLLGQPVARARSAAIHESQSLSFEMQLGSHPGFITLLRPLLVRHLGDQPAFEVGNLQRLLTTVKRGLIRVDADEVTYPAHVLLRHGIERALVDGEIEVDDIPALWDEGMRDLLGLDTRGNFKDGCMQDIHWAMGLYGYFPCYTLGAMYAAQWFASMRQPGSGVDGLDASIQRGDLAPLFGWLRQHIWLAASRWETPDLVRRATGSTLDSRHFKAHLQERYLA